MSTVGPSRFFQNNPAFEQVLAILAGPVGLAAMGLLAANDLVFKRIWPGWISGKLSDLAALPLLALLAAAALAVLVPGLRARPKLAGLIACAGVGLAFTWMKTDINFAGWAAATLPIRLVRDPSDLVALLGLIPTAGMIARNKTGVSTPVHKIRSHGYAALALASLLVLADAAAPDMGVHCLSSGEEGLVADVGFGSKYASRDGGLTWQSLESRGTYGLGECSSAVNGPTIIQFPNTSVSFRITPDVGVERSTDGGATWKTETNLQPFNQRELAYIQKTRGGTLIFPARPVSAQFDPLSGNLVLAMGYEGVLVRQADGTWSPAAVGSYRPRSLEKDGVEGILALLFGEIILAGITTLLVFSLLSVRIRPRKYDWIRLLLSGLLWAGIAWIFPPALTNGAYVQGLVLIVLLVAGLWSAGWAIADAIRLKGRSPGLLAWAFLAGMIFLMPYIIWGVGIIGDYYIAAALALALAIAGVFLALLKNKYRSGYTL